MQLSLLAKSRRRRKIRAKLDEIARIVSSPPTQDEPQALLSATDCAVITEHGDVIVTTAGSSSPFEAVAPKIRDIRASAAALCEYVGRQNTDVVHVRGQRGTLHAYLLGAHTLVTRTEVSQGVRTLDAVVARVDESLGVGGVGRTLIDQLAAMLQEF